MKKLIFLSASMLGLLGILFGAFGAHPLNNLLEANQKLAVFETAVKYHFIHTLALLAVGLLKFHYKSKLLNYSAIIFFLGIIIFSGSLYFLSISGVTLWGAVTPIGGVLFIIAWGLLFISILKE